MALEAGIDFVLHQTRKSCGGKSNLSKLRSTVATLSENDYLDFAEELALDNFREDLKERIVPLFCKQVISKGVIGVTEAVLKLHCNISWYFQLSSAWPDPCQFATKLQDIFVSSFLWGLDSRMKDVFVEFHAHYVQVSMWMEKYRHESEMCDEEFDDNWKDSFMVEWNGKTRLIKKDEVHDLMREEFSTIIYAQLYDLGLLHMLAEEPLFRVLEVEFRRYMEDTCAAEYEKCFICSGELQTWVDNVMMPWLGGMFEAAWRGKEMSEGFCYKPCTNAFQLSKKQWKQKLTFLMYETYTEFRITEMFSIITDFPESKPAIEDLKVCLEKTNQRPYLIKALRNELSYRVLHLGVPTEDIITMYISAVNALRMLDPSGVVMELVLEKYTSYLVGREDTVRKIMTGLLDYERDSDLSAELARGDSTPYCMGGHDASFLVEEITNQHQDWCPDPREADPDKSDRVRRRYDIIALLVGMYGSKKCFIEEYQKILSKRLLLNWFSGTSEDAEIKNLELLKLRFGEADMEKCAVMLKDVANSRRINACVAVDDNSVEINERKKDEVEVSALIVSSEYWPEYQCQDLNLPAAVKEALEKFNKAYENHKASRSLHWIHGESRMDVELELSGRTVKLQVTPLLASVISLFQEKDTWTLEDISTEIKAPTTMLRRNMVFWLQQGLLRENPSDTYTLVEEGADNTISPRTSAKTDLESIMKEDEEDHDAENSKQKQQEQVLWNYVQGMLMNFESLPLDRIHKMLRMFAMQDTSMLMDQTKLRTFLNVKVQEGVLSIDGGKYKLNKDS